MSGGSVWPFGLRLAHWVMAAAALTTAAMAIYLLSPPDWSPAYVQRYRDWIDVHKALGLIALSAAVALAVQHRRRPMRTGPDSDRRLAAIGQWTLLALVIVAALSGYLANALFGSPLAIPGLPVAPSPFARTPDVARVLSRLHTLSTYGLLILSAGHVAMAVRRQLSGKDPVLSLMLGLGSGRPRPNTRHER